MELLQGRELTRLIEPGKPLPLPQAVTIVQQIAQGLSAAHEREIVHRDLKPGNVFLMTMPRGNQELVKLLDFGISKVRGGVSNLTRTDTVMGTPNYMSPEQASGRTDEADGRADQFALAAIAYEMLSAHMAFPGESAPSVLYRVVHEQPPKLRTWVAGLPSALEKVVNRGLAKRPADRFPTIVAFSEAFDEAARAGGGAKLVAAARPIPAPNAVAPRAVGLGPSTTLRQSTGQMEAAGGDLSHPRAIWPRGLAMVVGGVAALVISTAVLRSRGTGAPPRIPPAGIVGSLGAAPPPSAASSAAVGGPSGVSGPERELKGTPTVVSPHASPHTSTPAGRAPAAPAELEPGGPATRPAVNGADLGGPRRVESSLHMEAKPVHDEAASTSSQRIVPSISSTRSTHAQAQKPSPMRRAKRADTKPRNEEL